MIYSTPAQNLEIVSLYIYIVKISEKQKLDTSIAKQIYKIK